MEKTGQGQFLSHCVATNLRQRFEDQARKSRPCQVCRGNQTVMSCACYHDIKTVRHRVSSPERDSYRTCKRALVLLHAVFLCSPRYTLSITTKVDARLA